MRSFDLRALALSHPSLNFSFSLCAITRDKRRRMSKEYSFAARVKPNDKPGHLFIAVSIIITIHKYGELILHRNTCDKKKGKL